MTTKELGMKALNGFITLVIMIIVAVLTYSMQSDRDDDLLINEKLEKKLDKTEFTIECISIEKKLDKKVDVDVFNEHMKFQQSMLDAQTTIQEDIKTILRTMPKQ